MITYFQLFALISFKNTEWTNRENCCCHNDCYRCKQNYEDFLLVFIPVKEKKENQQKKLVHLNFPFIIKFSRNLCSHITSSNVSWDRCIWISWECIERQMKHVAAVLPARDQLCYLLCDMLLLYSVYCLWVSLTWLFGTLLKWILREQPPL